MDAVDAVCNGHRGWSGIVVYGGVSAVYCIQCIHWFDLFAAKTLSHHHIPLFHCIHCILQPLVHCIHCVHWFDLFVSKTMSPPPYTTIPLYTASTAYCIHCIHCVLCPLCTAYCVHCILHLLCTLCPLCDCVH